MSAIPADREPTVFLFDDRELTDATAPARALLAQIPDGQSDWSRLMAYLTPRLPDFAERILRPEPFERLEFSAPDNPDFRLTVEQFGDVERLTLADLGHEGQYLLVDGLSQHAQEDELSALRDIVSKLPIPAWRRGSNGLITWANNAYVSLATRDADEELVWPLPELFPTAPETSAFKGSRRSKITAPDGKDHWFDCDLLSAGSDTIGFAMPVDGVIRAERSLRDFIQTLTKTFADLPIGLAIFDRDRRLALFNPALIDLVSLDGEFLSGRPTLFTFLDRLREARILPEPKNYADWRQQMIDLEKAAARGQYEETWPLASGQTYRVTGRPHPEGALAFLIEDISAEISLTRRFRSQIELAQSVIDGLDDGVAVFSHSGELVMSNSAYARLWGLDPSPTLGMMSVIEALRLWQSGSLPSPVWGEIRDFVGAEGERAEWDGTVTLADGTRIDCHVSPMARGDTLVRFARHTSERLQVRHSRRHGLAPPQGAMPQ